MPLLGYVMGCMTPKEFYKKGFHAKKGEFDKTSSKNYPFYFSADCTNIEYGKLHKIDIFK